MSFQYAGETQLLQITHSNLILTPTLISIQTLTQPQPQPVGWTSVAARQEQHQITVRVRSEVVVLSEGVANASPYLHGAPTLNPNLGPNTYLLKPARCERLRWKPGDHWDQLYLYT